MFVNDTFFNKHFPFFFTTFRYLRVCSYMQKYFVPLPIFTQIY